MSKPEPKPEPEKGKIVAEDGDWWCSCLCIECGDGIEDCCCPYGQEIEHECTCDGTG